MGLTIALSSIYGIFFNSPQIEVIIRPIIEDLEYKDEEQIESN